MKTGWFSVWPSVCIYILPKLLFWYIEHNLGLCPSSSLDVIKKFCLLTCSLRREGEEAESVPSCLNRTAEQRSEQKKASTVGKISAPLRKDPGPVSLTSAAFYSVAGQPRSPSTCTMLIHCMTATEGRVRPSSFLLRRSTCILTRKHLLFTLGLAYQEIQEEYYIVKNVVLSQVRMTGIYSFPYLFYYILDYTFAAFTKYSPILPHICSGAWLRILREERGRLQFWWNLWFLSVQK